LTHATILFVFLVGESLLFIFNDNLSATSWRTAKGKQIMDFLKEVRLTRGSMGRLCLQLAAG
jgi:hypothetical protein